MNRAEFQAIRDIPGKTIADDIRLAERSVTAPVLIAENIRIENEDGVELRLNISVNPEVGSKTFNVHVPGIGPVCRLDVDGPPHRPAGRSHKHSLQSDRCPDRNLPDGMVDRPDLAGKTAKEVFDVFCQIAQITHMGEFSTPEGT